MLENREVTDLTVFGRAFCFFVGSYPVRSRSLPANAIVVGMEKLRTKITACTVAGALTLGAGLAWAAPADAQTESPTEPSEAPGGGRAQRLEARLDHLVEEGVLSAEQADAIRARVDDRVERRSERRAFRAETFQEVADFLGTTTEQLRADLRAGTTVAELADDAGIDLDVIVDLIEALRTERIEAAVANGNLDREVADARLATLRDRITSRLNGERPS